MTDDTAATLQLTPDESGPMLPFCIGGRYLLTERIGAGGMAAIYRAFDQHFERTVAVKLMTPKLRADPEFDARFRREALVLSRLNDPHIVVVHDFGLDAEYGPFLVMELLQGETLRQRLNASGAMPPPAVIQLGEQLMLALAHAHEHEVIHRDLKPDNVFLLAQSGMRLHVRVLDFGIARILRKPNQTDRPTDTPRGTTVGTPRYMAPEQLAGKQASARSDLYAAAVVLYEALTGHVPELIGPRLRDRCPAAPEGLVRLIEQCLRTDPDERPVSATEAYLHLHQLGREVQGELLVSERAVAQLTARFRDPAPSARPAWSRGLRKLALSACLLLPILLWWSWPRSHPPTESESVAGVRLGNSRDDLVARFGKPMPAPIETLAPFLDRAAVADICRSDEPEILRWPGTGVIVVVAGGQTRAVVARQRAVTARNLRIGDGEANLRRAYPIQPSSVKLIEEAGAPANWGTVYRFDSVPLAVELHHGRVTALALWVDPK